MYVPKIFAETDTDVLHSMIRSHPLGTWIAPTDDELVVNHIPFVLENAYGAHGVLRGHINRANPIRKSLSTTKNSIVVFQGAETYITPSWYPSKQEHGKVVPTWNYVVVHVHGIPRVIDDRVWLLEHLNALTNEQESTRTQPWKVADAPEDFINRMVKGIVGIEIEICKIVGMWKTSQNKQQPDKSGVVAGLSSSKDSKSIEMASYAEQR